MVQDKHLVLHGTAEIPARTSKRRYIHSRHISSEVSRLRRVYGTISCTCNESQSKEKRARRQIVAKTNRSRTVSLVREFLRRGSGWIIRAKEQEVNRVM